MQLALLAEIDRQTKNSDGAVVPDVYLHEVWDAICQDPRFGGAADFTIALGGDSRIMYVLPKVLDGADPTSGRGACRAKSTSRGQE